MRHEQWILNLVSVRFWALAFKYKKMTVERQITELARTGGKSHRMCVPPMPEDTDMILSELIKRFKCALANER